MLQFLASLILLPVLSYKLGISDTTIGMVACFSKILGLVGIGTSWLLSANSTFVIVGWSLKLSIDYQTKTFVGQAMCVG